MLALVDDSPLHIQHWSKQIIKQDTSLKGQKSIFLINSLCTLTIIFQLMQRCQGYLEYLGKWLIPKGASNPSVVCWWQAYIRLHNHKMKKSLRNSNKTKRKNSPNSNHHYISYKRSYENNLKKISSLSSPPQRTLEPNQQYLISRWEKSVKLIKTRNSVDSYFR